MKTIGLFGGTFDPVHNGHLATAQAICDQLALDKLLLIPCQTPVLKSAAHASSQDRINMLTTALVELNDPRMQIDTREIDRKSPSYTTVTLQSLRADYPQASICLIVCADALADFDRWHDWRLIPTMAHIIGVNRGQQAPSLPASLKPLLHPAHSVDDLQQQPHGCYLALATPKYDISSTEIRKACQHGKDISGQVPTAVQQYIQDHNLYR